jgi:hypothetical protein
LNEFVTLLSLSHPTHDFLVICNFLLILGKILSIYSATFYIYRSMSSLNQSWMYGRRLSNEYINGLDAFIDFAKKDMVDNVDASFVVLASIARMRRNIVQVMC